MEPRIIKGHRFLCKKTVSRKGVGGKSEEAYTKGRVYRSEQDSPYPGANYNCGFITNNQRMQWHAWPYFPESHPWCNEKWTDYFDDLGE